MNRQYETAWAVSAGTQMYIEPKTNMAAELMQFEAFSRADDTKQAKSFFHMLQSGQVVLALQPVRFIQNQQATLYYETLLRQADSAGGEVCSLGYVIQPLERLGLVWQLDVCVLQTVIHALQQHPGIRLGSNLSPLSLRNSDGWKSIFATLQQQPDLASRLVLEITESVYPSDVDEATAILQTLRELGCWIALDDLGTGINTLDMAWRMQPDIVKLDKSLMHGARDLEGGSRLQRLVEALRPQCRYLVAEGVETEEDLLRSAVAGVHAAQGYFIGKPDIHPDCLSQMQRVDAFYKSAGSWL